MRFELLAWAFTLFAALVLSLLDPLGVTSQVKILSNNAFYDAVGGDFAKSKPELDVTVVLIEDGDLHLLGETWPLSHETHAQLITEISQTNPRAIISDFFFQDSRSDTGSKILIEALATAQDHHPVVVLHPNLENTDRESDQLAKSIKQLETRLNFWLADPAVLKFYGDTTVLPTYTQSGEDTIFTPALTALMGICRLDSAYCQIVDKAKKQESMELTWPGVPRSCLDSPDRDLDCPNRSTNWLQRLVKRSMSIMLPRWFLSPQDELSRWYPYDTISAVDVLNGTFSAEFFENRIVLIGGRIKGIRDTVESPSYGTLPGVFAHAAAVDNLFVFDGQPYRSGRPFQLSSDVFDIIYIALVVTTLFFIRGLTLTFRYPKQIWSAGGFFDLLLVAIISFTYAILEVSFFRTSPDYWILGPTLVSFSFLWMKTANIGKAITRYSVAND